MHARKITIQMAVGGVSPVMLANLEQRSASFAAREIVACATNVAKMSRNLEIGFAVAVRLAARSTLALLFSM